MTWIQQHDSAVRLHFLSSLAGLSACTKIPKKSLLDFNSLDIFPKRESNMQQHCREALGRASCPIRILSDHCTAETPDTARDTGWLSSGTANCSWVSKQSRRTHPRATSSPPCSLHKKPSMAWATRAEHSSVTDPMPNPFWEQRPRNREVGCSFGSKMGSSPRGQLREILISHLR